MPYIIATFDDGVQGCKAVADDADIEFTQQHWNYVKLRLVEEPPEWYVVKRLQGDNREWVINGPEARPKKSLFKFGFSYLHLLEVISPELVKKRM